MTRFYLGVALVLGLTACQLASDSRFNEPFFYEHLQPGVSKVVLHQALTLPAQQARTYIQGGRALNRQEVHIQEANCEFEVRQLSPTATQIKPDTFVITRVVRDEELFSRTGAPLMVADMGNGADLFKFSTRSTVRSKMQPNVRYFTCSHMEHLSNGGDHLRYSQFLHTVGNVLSLGE